MKTIKLTLLLSFVFAVFGIQNTHAQWTDMEWKTYNLKFKYPTDFTIKQNDSTTFTATGSIFTMTIDAWEDYDFETPEEICNQAVEQIECTHKTPVESNEISYRGGLSGYRKYYTGYQNGRFMHMIVVGFQDDIDLYNYTVKILYWDDPKQNKVDYDAAQYIIDNIATIE